MSAEVKVRGPATGATLYFTIMGSGSSIWSTSGGTGAFTAFSAADWTDYAISLTEQGATNIYKGNFPSAVPAGAYDVDSRRQVGASADTTDPSVGTGEVQWTGTAAAALSDLSTSGQLGGYFPIQLAKSYAVSGFTFYVKSAADHVTPFTSGVISGQISKNGGSFGALQSGNVSEIGNGFYKVNLTSGDLNASVVALLFNGVGVSGGNADPVPMVFVLQKTV